MGKGIKKAIFFVTLAIPFWACRPKGNGEEHNQKILTSQTLNIKVHPDTMSWPNSFEFGEEAEESLIERMDISITAQGKGLPEGKGFAYQGEAVYQMKCVACHGANGWEGPFDRLVTHETSKAKTIGNYWPYATTIFDYVRRTMPYNAPGSLSDEEVYQLTAFLLYANGIVERNEEINAETLPKVEMPAKERFVPDDREGGPEVR